MLVHARVYCAVVIRSPHDVDAVHYWYVMLLRYVTRGLAVVLLKVQVSYSEDSDHEVRVLF